MEGYYAVILFVILIFVWRSIYVRHGNIRFWQLVSKQPEVAYNWMKDRAVWKILKSGDPRISQFKSASNLEGPFKMFVPSMGGMIDVFAEREHIEASQQEFIELFGGSGEKIGFPWFSWIGLCYPVVSMVWMASTTAPILPTLGYGFANLGYLLLASGILVGSFRALGFRYRITTMIAAIIVWIIGAVFSNL